MKIEKICWVVFGLMAVCVSLVSLFSVGICLSYGLVIPAIVLCSIGSILLFLGFKLITLAE
jgi:hypothetical protein